MDRRSFLTGAGLVGASGVAGWAIRDQSDGSQLDRARLLETGDQAGLRPGHAGAFGIRRVIYSVPMSKPFVALTFDDGPDPEFTPRVLEILASHAITATFNAMGYNALHHTDILRDLVRAGHEVGNHTWTHRDLSTTDLRETTYEVRRGREVIEELSGQQVRFFRPPRGELSGAALRLVAQEGNDILMWSVTGSISGREQAPAIVAFVVSHLEPGAIIGYHDGIGRGTFDRSSPGARSLIERRRAEVAGLPEMLERGLAMGYSFMKVSELLTHEAPGLGATMTTDPSTDADAEEPAVTNPPDATAPARSTTGTLG